MEASGFQAPVAQLGDLSEVQHSALLVALKRKPPVAEAFDLIDTRYMTVTRCRPLGSKVFGRCGGVERLGALSLQRLRMNLQRLNALPGSPFAEPLRCGVWLAYAQALIDSGRLRNVAAR